MKRETKARRGQAEIPGKLVTRESRAIPDLPDRRVQLEGRGRPGPLGPQATRGQASPALLARKVKRVRPVKLESSGQLETKDLREIQATRDRVELGLPVTSDLPVLRVTQGSGTRAQPDPKASPATRG